MNEGRNGAGRREVGGRRRAARGSGFTIIELVVVMALLVIILGGATMVLLGSQRSVAEINAQFALQQTGRNVSERLLLELRGADASTILGPAPLVPSDTISFQRVIGFDEALVAPILSPRITLAFQSVSPSEGYITYTEAGQPTLQLSGHVLGLRFESITGGLLCSVDVGILDGERKLIRNTFIQKIAFRNGL